MQIEPITVHRSDTNTEAGMHIRPDRLEAFKNLMWDPDLLTAERVVTPYHSPGLSGLACLGLSTMFVGVPLKFPVVDLQRFLAQQADMINLWEVEARLEIMANRFNQIDPEGNDR